MELTPHQRAEIKEITQGLTCSKDFECRKSEFDVVSKAVDIGFESLLECSQDNKEWCKFLVLIVNLRFCTCPLRIYIVKNLRK